MSVSALVDPWERDRARSRHRPHSLGHLLAVGAARQLRRLVWVHPARVVGVLLLVLGVAGARSVLVVAGIVGVVVLVVTRSWSARHARRARHEWSLETGAVDYGLQTPTGRTIRVARWRETDGIMRVLYRLPRGLTAANVERALPALADSIGATRGHVEAVQPGMVTVTYVVGDPIGVARPASLATVPGAGPLVRSGRLETGGDLCTDLGAAAHIGVQGQTRSGKSVFVYGLLAPMAGRRDVIVCGVDPTGILLGPWSGHPFPELRDTSGTPQGAAGVLGELVATMAARIEWLASAGVDKITPSAEWPILLVVLEEWPGTMALAEAADKAAGARPGDRVAPVIAARVRRLLLEGAKVGVRVLLVAQRADADTVGGTERLNLGTRVTFRVDNSDAVRMFHPQAGPDRVAALPTMAPGTGLVEGPSVPLSVFRADLVEYVEYAAHVRQNVPQPAVVSSGTEA